MKKFECLERLHGMNSGAFLIKWIVGIDKLSYNVFIHIRMKFSQNRDMI